MSRLSQASEPIGRSPERCDLVGHIFIETNEPQPVVKDEAKEEPSTPKKRKSSGSSIQKSTHKVPAK